jgi:uncharacterized protein YggT (Ycf19 family)
VEAVLYVIAAVIAITLDVASLAFLLRALMPLFCDVETNKIYLFVCLLTEPFIIPVRAILVKFNWLQGSPFDWSFTISYLLIAFVRMFL